MDINRGPLKAKTIPVGTVYELYKCSRENCRARLCLTRHTSGVRRNPTCEPSGQRSIPPPPLPIAPATPPPPPSPQPRLPPRSLRSYGYLFIFPVS